MAKIYCDQCKFYNCSKKSQQCDITYDCDNIHEQCEAPQNIRQIYKSAESDKYISCPSIINRFNNCTWFGEKTSDDTENEDGTTDTFINDTI